MLTALSSLKCQILGNSWHDWVENTYLARDRSCVETVRRLQARYLESKKWIRLEIPNDGMASIWKPFETKTDMRIPGSDLLPTLISEVRSNNNSNSAFFDNARSVNF